MPKLLPGKTQISFFEDNSVYEEMQAVLAEQGNRTVSSYLRELLRADLQKRREAKASA